MTVAAKVRAANFLLVAQNCSGRYGAIKCLGDSRFLQQHFLPSFSRSGPSLRRRLTKVLRKLQPPKSAHPMTTADMRTHSSSHRRALLRCVGPSWRVGAVYTGSAHSLVGNDRSRTSHFQRLFKIAGIQQDPVIVAAHHDFTPEGAGGGFCKRG